MFDDLDRKAGQQKMYEWLIDPTTWSKAAEEIGEHPYRYDLSDMSHRLDVVQIVCEALARLADV